MGREKKKEGKKFRVLRDKNRFGLQHTGDLSPTLHITMQRLNV